MIITKSSRSKLSELFFHISLGRLSLIFPHDTPKPFILVCAIYDPAIMLLTLKKKRFPHLNCFTVTR